MASCGYSYVCGLRPYHRGRVCILTVLWPLFALRMSFVIGAVIARARRLSPVTQAFNLHLLRTIDCIPQCTHGEQRSGNGERLPGKAWVGLPFTQEPVPCTQRGPSVLASGYSLCRLPTVLYSRCMWQTVLPSLICSVGRTATTAVTRRFGGSALRRRRCGGR
jgi:hypothetical protein